jgi:hypothetical protein
MRPRCVGADRGVLIVAPSSRSATIISKSSAVAKSPAAANRSGRDDVSAEFQASASTSLKIDAASSLSSDDRASTRSAVIGVRCDLEGGEGVTRLTPDRLRR